MVPMYNHAEYRLRERRFIESLMADILEMVKQNPRLLCGYIAQRITGVLMSPEWNIYQAKVSDLDEENNSQAAHIWATIVERVAGFCADTEPHTYGRVQVDWILLQVHRVVFNEISASVLDARRRHAPDRV